MDNQLGTLAGTISAIQGNAQYYAASSETMRQLSSEVNRVSTRISDAQIGDILAKKTPKAKQVGIVVACEGAHAAIASRLPMLTQLSRNMATTAGRDKTEPGLMIPAWDDKTTSTAHEDMIVAYPYNLWDPAHQIIVTGREQTTEAHATGSSFMELASERWQASNHQICNATAGADTVKQVFSFNKDLSEADTATFFKQGWSELSVNFQDWLWSRSYNRSISPTAIQSTTGGQYSTLLAAPVVWDVAVQGCFGDSADPCCDSSLVPCTVALNTTHSQAALEVVRMAAAWVPTQNTICDTDASETGINNGLGADVSNNRLRPIGLFPPGTKTCKSSVFVPPVHGQIENLGTGTRAFDWGTSKGNELCTSVNLENWNFTPLRGVPLFGQWVLTDANNAGNVQRYYHINGLDSSGKATVVRTTPPDAAFATDNAGVKVIRVVFSAMAEPQASKAPPSYDLKWSYP
jgi:hypothetical protein